MKLPPLQDLRYRNTIFGEPPSLDEFLEPAEEQEVGDSLEFEGGDKAIAAAVKQELSPLETLAALKWSCVKNNDGNGKTRSPKMSRTGIRMRQLSSDFVRMSASHLVENHWHIHPPIQPSIHPVEYSYVTDLEVYQERFVTIFTLLLSCYIRHGDIQENLQATHLTMHGRDDDQILRGDHRQ
ncbi:hypothetical protein AZE42_08991 [Rhizopogon vesiculosus]|uniref:Uncharacterized protein n=1 Tax=Rhizopogon vesiculosus TaxID=180088 RepID=A0A1J8QAU2_9AGAM|nr:hypothetical protein AZE42_08991 [Rhizopogon vesiculosus]